jgi:hypothetical protein
LIFDLKTRISKYKNYPSQVIFLCDWSKILLSPASW